MTTTQLIIASFRHYGRSHLGLFFGVFLAAAVLSGSLLVGDSVRASLRRAAAERLGKVQAGLLGGDRWFTEDLARKTGSAPLILLRGSVSESTGKSRANAVQVLGVDESFFKLSPEGNSVSLPKDSLALNESLARRLGVKIGDTVLVRLEKPSAISRDAPLSGEANQDITLRRKVTAILSGSDFGNFQLQASQTAPDNIFIPLAELAEALGKKGRVNGMLDRVYTSASVEKWVMVTHDSREAAVTRGFAQRILSDVINSNLSIEDFSLKLTRLPSKSDAPTSDLRPLSPEWELTTDRVFFDDVIAQKILQAVPGSYGVLTYLVNGLSSAKGRVPYSMVTAIPAEIQDSRFKIQAELGVSDDSTIINQWLADDLQVAVGGKIDIRFFTVGLGRDLQEQTASFTVRGIMPMTDPAMNPSWAPDFPGVTDAKNCRDWQPGIPMKLDAIRDQDEAYWKQYKTTPKAFINLTAGQKLWSNRFGNLTAIRFSDYGQDVNKLREQLVNKLRLADIGLVPRDFSTEAAAAAKGSVDFGGLFIGLSLFLIAASLVFSALLLIFTLEGRATQIGLLFSLGWRENEMRRLILWEAGLVATLGSLLGLLGGLIYTKCALAGLNGVWSGATVGLKLTQNFQPLTLAIAFGSSLIVSLGTIWLATRRIFKAQPKDLLAGDAWSRKDDTLVVRSLPTDDKSVVVPASQAPGKLIRVLPVFFLLLALGLTIAGSRATSPEAIAGMFFGSGFCLLTTGLLLNRRWLRARSDSSSAATSIIQIGARNITRRSGRSLAVIGMMAGGIFLVIAVNAFRLGAESDPAKRDSGTGGFELIGESTLPIYEDLNSLAAWDSFALDEGIMHEALIVPFRVREGDDASCLNLNKAQRPLLCAVNPAALGAIPHDPVGADGKPRPLAEQEVLPSIGDRQPVRFSFAEGSWDRLLDSGGEFVPGIVDQATAMWGLGKGIGDTISYTDAQGREFKIKLVGLLAGSVLQGKVILSEKNFLVKYPDSAGYKLFLIATSYPSPCTSISDPARYHANATKAVSSHLTQQLGARGLAIEPTADRLAAFNAVQNTYIVIFTVLGGLGVLLGTFGLGVLAMRNVLERRGEFGLMLALGFKPGALRAMVLSEHAALLVGGLLLGLVSAAIAVWPNLKQGANALPLAFLFWLNLGILAFGIAACWLAAVLALRGRLLDAVRRE